MVFPKHKKMGRKQSQRLPLRGEEIYPLDGSPEIGEVTNAQGLKLTTYAWRVEAPRAAVLLIHGMQMHARFEFLRHLQPGEPDLFASLKHPPPSSDTQSSGDQPTQGESAGAASSRAAGCFGRWCIYEGSWVQQLNGAGYSVYAGDLQSFGLSEGWKGRRCAVERLDHFGLDVISFAEFVSDDLLKKATPAGEAAPPLFLLGISMGGYSVIRALEIMGREGHWLLRRAAGSDEDRRSMIIGCVALAPMLSIEKASAGALHKAVAKVGGVLSRLTPHLRVVKVPPANFPWIDLQKLEDPLVTAPRKIPCRMGVEVLRGVCSVHADATFIPSHIRLLIFHAENDTIVEPTGSKRFHNESAAHLAKCEFRLLSGGRGHYLVIEPQNAETLSAVMDWMKVLP